MSQWNHTLSAEPPFRREKRFARQPIARHSAPSSVSGCLAKTVIAAAVFLAGLSAAWAQARDGAARTAPHFARHHSDVTARMRLVDGQWQLSLTGTAQGALIAYVGTMVNAVWQPPLPEASGDLAHFVPVLEAAQWKELLSALAGPDAQQGGAVIRLPADRADRLPSVTLTLRTSPLTFQSPVLGTKDEPEMLAFLAQSGWSADEIRCFVETGDLPEGRTLGEDDDCGPVIEQTICVEGTVSIPPFVNTTIKVCTTVRAPACEFAAAREAALREARQTLAEMIEDLKKRAQELAQFARDLTNRFLGLVRRWLYAR